MSDYLTLHLDTKYKVQKQHFYYCSTFHSHSRVFNNKNISYPKMSVKGPIACSVFFNMKVDTGLNLLK